MYKLTKLNLESVAIYSAIMYFIGSLILILPMMGIMSVVQSFAGNEYGNEGMMLGSVAAMLVLPFIYAIFGTIVNLIIAGIYNLVSKKLGGFKFSVEKIGKFEEE